MKLISMLVFVNILYNTSFAQCNTTILNNRKYNTYKTTKERNLNIRVIAGMTYKLIESVSNQASEMGVYIKTNLRNGEVPSIQKYINYVSGLKKSLIKGDQTKETISLDNYTLCYYVFLENQYKKMQTALKQRNKEKLIEEYQKATNELALGIDNKGNLVLAEIKRLYTAYPLQK